MSKTVSFDTEVTLSDAIDGRLFGGNFLIGRDDLVGTFDDKAVELELNLLRWPGGALAEDYFDITDPDAMHIADQGAANTLSGFLSYCHTNGITAAIVIPVKKYGEDLARAETEVRAFVADLVAGTYGALPADTIVEVGNEYYADSQVYDRIGDNVYGELASLLTTVIEEEAAGAVSIAVQAGRKTAANRRIIEEFDTAAEQDAVDFVVVHQYPWRFDAVESRFVKQNAILDSWETAGITAKTFMSEWNMGSSDDPDTDDDHDYGLAQNVAMLELFNTSVLSGIDYGALWGIQQRTKTSIGSDEGKDVLYASGILYKMLTTSLTDGQIIKSVSTGQNSEIETYGYITPDSYVLFVAAKDIDLSGGPVSTTVLLDGKDVAFDGLTATRLTTDDGLEKSKPTATVEILNPDTIAQDGEVGATISFTHAYDVIQLVFDRTDPVIGGTTQNGTATEDLMNGGTGADLTRGHMGDDTLFSYSGNDDIRGGRADDYLSAGEGNDSLKGGAGNDQMIGGDGDDLLEGGGGRDYMDAGTGADILHGGSGRDKLFGGDGEDTLEGGTGNDRIWGGDGADTFIFSAGYDFDRIWDFDGGDGDVIDLSALATGLDITGLKALMTEVRVDVHIAVAGGIIAINRTTIAELDADDFIF